MKDVRQLLDITRYPIDRPGDAVCQRLVADVREQLADDGCAVVSGFLSSRGLAALCREARERLPHTYYSPDKRCNVYFDSGDPGLPPDHPRNRFLERNNGFITADHFDPQSAAYQLYRWAPLATFLADCLNRSKLHIYADPISNMIVNVGRTGEQFNWHFDTNEFTITLLLQAAESGGEFEYVPDLRSPRNECYDAVGQVLNGDRSRTHRLQLSPGDLQLFLGRYALHRVTPVEGRRERLLLIMSFTEKPGVIGSLARVKSLYGKTANVHQRGSQQRVRSDRLID